MLLDPGLKPMHMLNSRQKMIEPFVDYFIVFCLQRRSALRHISQTTDLYDWLPGGVPKYVYFLLVPEQVGLFHHQCLPNNWSTTTYQTCVARCIYQTLAWTPIFRQVLLPIITSPSFHVHGDVVHTALIRLADVLQVRWSVDASLVGTNKDKYSHGIHIFCWPGTKELLKIVWKSWHNEFALFLFNRFHVINDSNSNLDRVYTMFLSISSHGWEYGINQQQTTIFVFHVNLENLFLSICNSYRSETFRFFFSPFRYARGEPTSWFSSPLWRSTPAPTQFLGIDWKQQRK